MGRYRFAVEYLGAPYAGWQIQPGQATVQAELEKALGICLRAPVLVVGAGRTDAGVHASGQVAHFECEADLDAPPGRAFRQRADAGFDFRPPPGGLRSGFPRALLRPLPSLPLPHRAAAHGLAWRPSPGIPAFAWTWSGFRRALANRGGPTTILLISLCPGRTGKARCARSSGPKRMRTRTSSP